MAASDISRQIEEAEEEKRLYVKELTSLNERIERLEERLDNGEALTPREEARLTEWKARRSEVQRSSDLLTQRLRELDAKALAAAQGESCCCCY